MDLKQIEELMTAMHRSRIKRIAIKREGFEIELERECIEELYKTGALPPPPAPAEVLSEEREATQEEVSSLYEVTSPMVGTFYSSPSPDDPLYVKVGDLVEEETVVCIIEAMKVMNEVKAGVKGTVAELLVKNGEPVEFGTKIFRIKAE